MRVKGKFIIIPIVLLLFVSCGLFACRAQVYDAQSGASQKDLAPDFTLKDINGNDFSFSQTRGKVVILDFWATWCPPCRMGIPEFQALYEEYSAQGLEIVGIALDVEGAAVVKPFVERNGVTYPVVIGNREIANKYGGIRGIPTTFIIDRKGRIVEKYVGYKAKEVFKSAIGKLL